MHTQKIQIGVVVAILLVVIGAFGWSFLQNSKGSDGQVVNIGGVDVNVPKGATIEIVEDELPELDHTMQFEEGVPVEVKNSLQNNVEKLVAVLREDPSHYNAWLDLALQYKVAGDYRAAEKVWLYLVDAAPQAGLSAHNLGTLYHLNLRDPERAESYFLEAVKREPNEGAYYLSFHELYRYSYKTDTTKAVDILKQGLVAMPENTDLMLTLAVYYRDEKKDNALARKYYEQARDALAKAGKVDIQRAVETEILKLSR